MKNLNNRNWAWIIMAFIAAIIEPISNVDIPENNLELFLGSVALLAVSFLSEGGLRKLLNVSEWPFETWYNSRRIGMLFLAFVAMLLNPVFGLEVSTYLQSILVAVFGIVGVLGFTLQDVGTILNPPPEPE